MTSKTPAIVDLASPQFSLPVRVNPAPGPPFNKAMSFLAGTNPCTITFNERIYIFFNGSGNDGVWFTTSADGIEWSPVDRVPGLPIAPGASPAAAIVPWSNRLFVFANTSPGPGLWFSSVIFSSWAKPRQLPTSGVLGTTNPSALDFNGTVYIFYSGIGLNGIWSIPIGDRSDSVNISPIQLASAEHPGSFFDILAGTSPCAVIFGDEIFLFYTSAGPTGLATGTTTPATGTGNCLIFATFSSDGERWSIPQQVGAAASPGTSPAAVAVGDPSSAALYLFWPTDPAVSLARTTDGKTWTLLRPIVVERMPKTSPSATKLGTTPYLFWTGLNGASSGSGIGAVYSTFKPLDPS